MILKGKRVLVLGGEENPALPVLKSLGSKGVHLTVASHVACAPGLWSRYTTARLRSPNPWEGEERYTEWALGICRSGEFDLVIPLGEMSSLWIAKNQNQFLSYTQIPFPDVKTYMIGRDKALTMKAAAQLGIPIPKTYYPDEGPIDDIACRISYPAVIKPRISYAARGIFFPENKSELKKLYSYAAARFGGCIIQEFIPQTGMQYKAESIQDSTGQVKAIGVYDKPRYYPTTGGSSTLNRTVYRPDICKLTKTFVEGIGWFGIGDCDFIEDPRDGVVKLMEINPRFTRSIRILVEAGLDFPAMLLRAALGEELSQQNFYKIGLHMRYLIPDCLWFLKSDNRWRAKPSFFKFLGNDLIYEIFSFHDPKPGAAYLASIIAKMTNKKNRSRLLRKI